PYATLRSVYLQSRVADITAIRGGEAGGALDDPLLDPEGPAGDVNPPKGAGVEPELPVKP
ncbi:MAG: VacJ family lipoprotein, partial [Novosphingobium sp.]|nr:VacJ family lipoprotein [Novosphingobium sp.]